MYVAYLYLRVNMLTRSSEFFFQFNALYWFIYMTYISWKSCILHVQGLKPLVSLAK